MFENDLNRLLCTMARIHNAVFPDMIPIDNTSLCNLRCSMCSHRNMLRKPGIMTMDLYKSIVDEVARENRNTKLWMTFFGEAALLRDMPERIAYAKSRGCTNVAINTNGTLITTEIAEQYIRAGLDYLYVGIDAARSETYAKLRVGSQGLEQTIANVLTYKRLLERFGNCRQQLFVQFVVMDENEAEVEEFGRFWYQQGITVKYRPKVTWIKLVSEDRRRKVRQVPRFPCAWMVETLCITHDGGFALCAVDVNCLVEIDNLKLKSVREIWNTTHRELRQRFFDNRNLPTPCLDCPDWIGKISVYRG